MCDAQTPVPDSRLLAAPKAESRKPRAESRKPRAESREPRAESREPRAESREPRAGHRRVPVAGFAVACAGLTPRSAGKRPDAGALRAFVVSLENRIDEAARAQPQHGFRASQRLNRAEYARAIRAMLGLEVDVTQWLPPDTMSHNFDNIAAVQNF